jgi:hypothetical protein
MTASGDDHRSIRHSNHIYRDIASRHAAVPELAKLIVSPTRHRPVV